MQQDWSSAHADFLSSLSHSELDSLLRRSKCINLDQRELLFRAGDCSSTVYIVASGCIKLFQLSSNGREIILWVSFPGEIFGIAELVNRSDREIYAVANVLSKVYSISQADFLDFLRNHPEAAMRAIGILSARVRSLGSRLVDLTTDDVETRLVRLLLRFSGLSLHTRCAKFEGNDEICLNVRLTHQDLANLIGASRQTVTKTLLSLRQRGVIRAVDFHIHVKQLKQLQRIVEPMAF